MQAVNRNHIESFTLHSVEISDDSQRAILTIPLFHVGPNDKGLYWTEEMLKKIAPLYQGIPFRYDLGGQEGSSHTMNKLSSPYYDVGWTYSGEKGAWYDSKTKALWVRGEVTHPEVVQKLSRKTSDGKREVNYASMGAIVDNADCNICEKEYGNCEHERLKPYNGKVAYKVPTQVSKGLHVALTNDPADGEAEISDCIFQELGGSNMNTNTGLTNGYQATVTNNHVSANPNQIPGGLAPSSPMTGQPGAAPSPEAILRDIAERLKTVENKVFIQETPEVVNSSPQDQFTQPNMSVSTDSEEKQTGETNMGEEKRGQTSNSTTPVNPKQTPEMQDAGASVNMQVANLLRQAAALLSGGQPEMQDMGKEAMDADKSQAKDHHDSAVAPTEHMQPGDAVASASEEDESNKKNKAAMNKPGEVAIADNSKTELADLKSMVAKIAQRMELQDSSIPEFGGSNVATQSKVNVADMGARGRAEKYGDYGKWGACFGGHEEGAKFIR